MAQAESHVCPWWVAYTFDNPLRKLFHNPHKMLSPYIEEGMRAMDVGCGMGYFSIGMARIVGETGKVIAVDLQQKMLDIMQKRARRAGLLDRIDPRLCRPDDIVVTEDVHFILNFWMVHEVKDQQVFFNQLKSRLVSGGNILIAEPKMHVTPDEFQLTLGIAESAGLHVSGQPVIRFSRTALLASR
jgi:2-polyprenyl-3-methyl-5-hydroxy-6-metoxy-1,4-benzoquinol methylase